MIVAHERAEALERLTLSDGGSLRTASIGPAFRVSDHWEAIASFEMELASNDYSILELHLEGTQIAKPEVKGIGIRKIFIDPLPQKLAPGEGRSRLFLESQRWQAKLLAIAATGWRIIKPLRRTTNLIRSIRRWFLRGRVYEQRKR